MGKVKRKPRGKFNKKMDITKPITLEMLGTANDPCFGKHYDPRTSECQRCGDCEFCAIAMGQISHMTRKELEKKNAYKDIEEKSIKSKLTKKEAKKLVKARIYEMAKQKTKVEVIARDIFSNFAKDGWRKQRTIKYINLLAEKYGKISITKSLVEWNQKS